MASHFPWCHNVLSHYIVYVSQIPRTCSRRKIERFLSQYGEIAWFQVFKNKDAKECYSHVIFKQIDAYANIFGKSVHVIDNAQLRVSMWKKSSKNQAFEDLINKRKVFLKNLHPRVTENQIYQYFKKFGGLENVEIPKNHHNNMQRSIAFVLFEDECTIQQVLSMSKQIQKDTGFKVRSYAANKQELPPHQQTQSAISSGSATQHSSDACTSDQQVLDQFSELFRQHLYEQVSSSQRAFMQGMAEFSNDQPRTGSVVSLSQGDSAADKDLSNKAAETSDWNLNSGSEISSKRQIELPLEKSHDASSPSTGQKVGVQSYTCISALDRVMAPHAPSNYTHKEVKICYFTIFGRV
jgi:RNA recognition motif. (a.k.a. RRM, RBD, or RNP domain)